MAKYYRRSNGYKRRGYKGSRKGYSKGQMSIPRSVSRYSKNTSYNGIYYKKIEYFQWIVFDTLSGKGDFTVSWGAQGTSDSQRAFIDDAQDFLDCQQFFQLWKVKGLKVVVTPLCENNNGSTALYDLMVASDPNTNLTFSVTDTAMGRLADFKVVPANRPYKKYINTGTFYAKKAEEWKNTSYGGGTTQYYSDASTHFRLSAVGFSALARLARIHIIWYCAFKGT